MIILILEKLGFKELFIRLLKINDNKYVLINLLIVHLLPNYTTWMVQYITLYTGLLVV